MDNQNKTEREIIAIEVNSISDHHCKEPSDFETPDVESEVENDDD